MKHAALLSLVFLLNVFNAQSQSAPDFDHWLDSAYLWSQQREFTQLLEKSEEVLKAFDNQKEHPNFAYANLFCAKMYQIKSRMDLSGDALMAARNEIAIHHAKNDSLNFLMLRYEADQAMYTSQYAQSDSLLKLAQGRGSKSFGDTSYQMALYYSSVQFLARLTGKYYESLAAAEKSLEIGYSVFDSLHPSIAGFENNLGVSYSELDKTKLAIKHTNNAMNIIIATKGESDIGVIQILNNLGSSENTLGNHKKALAYLQRGIDLYDALNTDEYNDMIIDLLYNGAYSYVKLADYKRAEEYMQQASRYLNENMALFKYYGGALDLDMAMHARLGGNIEIGRQKALQAYQKYEDAFGANDSELIYPLSELGFNALQSKDYEAAKQNFTKAIELLNKNDLIVSENGGDFYGWMAETLTAEMDWVEALTNLENSLNIYRQVYGENHFNVAWCFSSIGSCYSGLGDQEMARIYRDSAWMAILKEGESYISGPPSYNQIYPHIYLRDMIQDEMHFYLDQYEATDRQEFLRKGVDYGRLADAWIDDRRQSYIGSSSSAQLISNNYHIFEMAMNFCKELFERTNDLNYIDTSFYFAEKSKSSSLFNIVREIEIKNDDKIPIHLINELSGFEQDMQNFEAFVQEEKSYGDEADLSAIENWEKSLFQIEEDYYNLRTTINKNYVDYFNLKYNTAVASTDEVQNILPDETTLVEYFVGDSAIYVFIIDETSKTQINIHDKYDLAGLITRLNQSISEVNFTDTEQISDSIYQVVFAPLEPHIKNQNLIIVPDGPLHYLNFEILKGPEKNYLINQYNFSYENSASYLTIKNQSSRKNSNDNSWLGVAPGFSDQMKTEYKSTVPEKNWDQEYLNYIKQPNSEILIAGIGQKKRNAKSLIGIEANENNLLKTIGLVSTLHLSTHAEVNNMDPKRSKLVLAKSLDPKSFEDGYLNTNEIYNLKLQSDLVILSACNTGLGKLYRGDGMVSLARGFQYAGAKNIIMSLWSVDEQQSNKLIDEFYNQFETGKSVPSALRDAKLKYLEDNKGDLRHPFYWAGLVSIGTDTATSTPAFNKSPLFLGMAFVLLFLFVAWLFRKAI